MSLPVVLRPAASRDAEEARDYLEAQREGLGQKFMSRLAEVVARIGATPELYAAVWRTVRAARLKRFTYVVYYRVHVDRVEVLAVMHGRREDGEWQSRT